MQRTITTVARLISALGGARAVGAHLKCSPQEVSAWVRQREIPVGWQMRLAWMAEDRGLHIARKAFDPSGSFESLPRPRRGPALAR